MGILLVITTSTEQENQHLSKLIKDCWSPYKEILLLTPIFWKISSTNKFPFQLKIKHKFQDCIFILCRNRYVSIRKELRFLCLVGFISKYLCFLVLHCISWVPHFGKIFCTQSFHDWLGDWGKILNSIHEGQHRFETYPGLRKMIDDCYQRKLSTPFCCHPLK